MVTKTTTTEKSRLDDHSKRLQALEAAQIHFANQQADIIRKLSRVSEVLFGSDNPNEVSMKHQVKETNDMVREIKEQFEEAQKETATIRTIGFDRLSELERWRKKIEEGKEVEKEIKLMGIKTTAETKIAVINGAFVLLAAIAAWMLK